MQWDIDRGPKKSDSSRFRPIMQGSVGSSYGDKVDPPMRQITMGILAREAGDSEVDEGWLQSNFDAIKDMSPNLKVTVRGSSVVIFGPFLAYFAALVHPLHAVRCALRSAHADRILIGAWLAMLTNARCTSSGQAGRRLDGCPRGKGAQPLPEALPRPAGILDLGQNFDRFSRISQLHARATHEACHLLGVRVFNLLLCNVA